VQEAVILREEPVKKREIPLCHLAGARVNGPAVLQSQNGKPLAKHIRSDRKVVARIVVACAAQRIAIDHPTDAQSTEAKSFREIADHNSVGKARRRLHRGAMVDGMIHLIRYKLNAALHAEIV
jgi:hypothetical protein